MLYKRYINELANEEYRISATDFRTWLIDNNMMEKFVKSAKTDIIQTAVDYSVMIATVKAVAI